MSIIYCEMHDRRRDSDLLSECPTCEGEEILVAPSLLDYVTAAFVATPELASTERHDAYNAIKAALSGPADYAALDDLRYRLVDWCNKDFNGVDVVEDASALMNEAYEVLSALKNAAPQVPSATTIQGAAIPLDSVPARASSEAWPTAWRVWARGRKFTRGIYENPSKETFECWAADGDEVEPLYTAPQPEARKDSSQGEKK